MNQTIATVGPPHSGKTVFLSYLFSYAQKKYPAHTFFLQRSCPDGEGNWSMESDQEVVKKIRNKGEFSKDFMEWILTSIKTLAKQYDILFIDCGGKICKENQEIISLCTHFIVLSSNRPAMKHWLGFCQETCKCECLAVLDSTLDQNIRSYYKKKQAFGRLVHLDREFVPQQTIEIIHKIADHIFEPYT